MRLQLKHFWSSGIADLMKYKCQTFVCLFLFSTLFIFPWKLLNVLDKLLKSLSKVVVPSLNL